MLHRRRDEALATAAAHLRHAHVAIADHGLDGERDLAAGDFVCGMCDSSRLTTSAGLPPPGPASGSGGGGVGVGVRGPVPTRSGGGGMGVVIYTSGADYEERRPNLAQQSFEHRMIFRERINHVIDRVREAVVDDRARALASVQAEELDPGDVTATARLLVAQIDASEVLGIFDAELLADAFGVAAWSIGAEAGQEPDTGMLSYLVDARIRLAVGRFTPLVA